MRSYIAGAVLAAAFVLAPVATGYAPALAQDFSITNQGSLQIEGADLSPDWIRKLQAFWDLHAWYPKDASDNDESGVVKIHLRIHSDGQVWWANIEQGSGVRSIDNAAFIVFMKQWLPRFPPGTRARQADVLLQTLTEADLHISLHYVLAHRHDQPVNASTAPALSKQPFTVTNGPVKDTVVETMQRRTCTGDLATNALGDLPPDSILVSHDRITAVFYRKPDGKPWVQWSHGGGQAEFHPITELGVSAQWNGVCRGAFGCDMPHFDLWPDSDNPNHLSGRTLGAGIGTLNLTCETEVVPVVKSNSLLESGY
jgi:TonB family protein